MGDDEISSAGESSGSPFLLPMVFQRNPHASKTSGPGAEPQTELMNSLPGILSIKKGDSSSIDYRDSSHFCIIYMCGPKQNYYYIE